MEITNFRQTVEAMRNIGVPMYEIAGDDYSKIEVIVYDYVAGEIIMPAVKMDEYNAVRVFGDLAVRSIDLNNGHMVFTLNAADSESYNAPIGEKG